jgi:uncharacterized protein (TIGR03083 family)
LDWTVRDLVTHVGGVHRWAADIVENGRGELASELQGAVGTGPAEDELLDWFAAGHAGLVAVLRAAPAGLQCVTFLPAPSPRAFWARRQAHETAIHRADAEAAAGEVTPFDATFAQDGIAELLLGFAVRRRRKPIDRTASIALRASDGPAWLVRLGGDRVDAVTGSDGDAEVADSADRADLVVRGSSSEIYLWLWNRPSTARVDGDEAAAQLWRDSVRVRWS